jgi:hypothetical protein
LESLGVVQHKRGDLDGAERSYRELNTTYSRLLPPDHLDVTSSAASIAIVLTDGARAESAIDRATEAERILRDVLERRASVDGADSWRVAVIESHLADALALQRENLGEARALALASWERLSSDGVVPQAARASVLKGALERGVRVLEAASSVAPDSTDASAIQQWKSELDALRLGKQP